MQTFPDWRAPERGPEAGPSWDAEFLLGFLERSAARSASAARGAGVFRKKAASAHIVLKIEGRDISEGMARLVDRLIQIQGDIETVGND